MKKMRLLRAKVVSELNNNIAKNLDRYRSGNFDYLDTDQSTHIEIGQQFDEARLNEIQCEVTDHKEVECCIQIHEAMADMPPYLARDHRLWIYLTHALLLPYARTRWPIPADNEKAVSHIKMHFFCTGARGIERDNAASRLWWMASPCSRVQGLSLKESLTSFLYQYDVRANIIERPTTSQSVPVFSAVIKKLDASYKGQKELFERETFRALM